ncbi:Uncharacterised protein [Bordetella pertussis]|nr:Uncharacterised protein [Bordetella pertussis]
MTIWRLVTTRPERAISISSTDSSRTDNARRVPLARTSRPTVSNTSGPTSIWGCACPDRRRPRARTRAASSGRSKGLVT